MDENTAADGPLQMTTTEARPGGKEPARTDIGWHFNEEWFPAGQHTPGTYRPGMPRGQLADVYARHTGMFGGDLDLYKPEKRAAWEKSAFLRHITEGHGYTGHEHYVRRGAEGSIRLLVHQTPEQAADWHPLASAVPWGDIRSAGLAPSPGAAHPSGGTYEAVPGPDAVRYPDGTVVMTNVIRFCDGCREALESDGAHGRDGRPVSRGNVELPQDDGKCPLVLAWLQDTAELEGSSGPRSNRANSAANYLKRMAAEGHLVGGWIDEVVGRLPFTDYEDFEAMWATAPDGDPVQVEHDCCTPMVMPSGRPFDEVMAERAARAEVIPAAQEELAVLPGAGVAVIPAAPGASLEDWAAGVAAAYTPVDWDTAFREQPEEVNWLYRHWLEAGTINSLFAWQGTGKSLLAEEVSWSLACDGHSVLYIDEENRIIDWVERLKDMGAEPGDLASLHLYSFAALPPLDTPEGGYHLLALAVACQADLVVIDTTMRMVAGKENDSDTFLHLYRCALVPLKGRGITVLRLDHPGKDASRGQRGTSAKGDAEDTVWMMTTVTPEVTYRLERTKTRTAHGPPAYTLTRQKDPLRHAWSLGELNAVTELAAKLDELKVGPEAGRGTARAALAKAGVKARNTLLNQALRYRRAVPGGGDRSVSGAVPDRPGTAPERGEKPQVKPGKSCPGQVGDSSENVPLAPCPSPPHYGGDRGTAPVPDKQGKPALYVVPPSSPNGYGARPPVEPPPNLPNGASPPSGACVICGEPVRGFGGRTCYRHRDADADDLCQSAPGVTPENAALVCRLTHKQCPHNPPHPRDG